jgi:histidine phosphotransferase ChpT
MTELAGLVARRLCHDFAGPIGAISTALDLLEDDNNPEIRGLIRDSASGLAAALRLYRVILSPSEAPLANHEARALLADWVSARNAVTLDWQVSGEQIAAPAAATLLGLALVACEALTRGGKLTVGDDFVEADGPNLRLNRDVHDAIGGASGALTPRAALTQVVVANAGVDGQRVAMTAVPQTLRLRVHNSGDVVA